MQVPTNIGGTLEVAVSKEAEKTKVEYTITAVDGLNDAQLVLALKKGLVVPLQSRLRKQFPDGNFPKQYTTTAASLVSVERVNGWQQAKAAVAHAEAVTRKALEALVASGMDEAQARIVLGLNKTD
jgi:hypothetical protein